MGVADGAKYFNPTAPFFFHGVTSNADGDDGTYHASSRALLSKGKGETRHYDQDDVPSKEKTELPHDQ